MNPPTEVKEKQPVLKVHCSAKYCYKCPECESEMEVRHSMTERLEELNRDIRVWPEYLNSPTS